MYDRGTIAGDNAAAGAVPREGGGHIAEAFAEDGGEYDEQAFPDVVEVETLHRIRDRIRESARAVETGECESCRNTHCHVSQLRM